MKKIQWSYGITAVPERVELLSKTLHSLHNAGFEDPRIFMDGAKYDPRFGPNISCREPRVRAYTNWILGMVELYMRKPYANYFAMFQDDILCCKNLREYLEFDPIPDRVYRNLICYPTNLPLCRDKVGWFETNQLGHGAQGLVFTREGLTALLRHKDTFAKPLDRISGWRGLDGHILNVLKGEGYKEQSHNPSLLEHVGWEKTSMDLGAGGHVASQPQIRNFVGEVDILQYMKGTVV